MKTITHITDTIDRPSMACFKLGNGDCLKLSKAVEKLHKEFSLHSMLARIIKHQYNQAIQRQVFQVWQLAKHKSDELALVIRDRYNEILVYESFMDYQDEYPAVTLYLIDGKTLYLPEELN